MRTSIKTFRVNVWFDNEDIVAVQKDFDSKEEAETFAQTFDNDARAVAVIFLPVPEGGYDFYSPIAYRTPNAIGKRPG